MNRTHNYARLPKGLLKMNKADESEERIVETTKEGVENEGGRGKKNDSRHFVPLVYSDCIPSEILVCARNPDFGP